MDRKIIKEFRCSEMEEDILKSLDKSECYHPFNPYSDSSLSIIKKDIVFQNTNERAKSSMDIRIRVGNYYGILCFDLYHDTEDHIKVEILKMFKELIDADLSDWLLQERKI